VEGRSLPVTALRPFFIPATVDRELRTGGGSVKGKPDPEASRFQGESRGVGGSRRPEPGFTINNKPISNTVNKFYCFSITQSINSA
jgi:hypothetical protein